MTDNTPMGKSQDHRSNALALACIGVLVAMIILAWRAKVWPVWEFIVLSIAGTIFFAVVNFMNTVEENYPWKSYGAWIFAILLIPIYVGPIGTAYIHQP